MRFAIYDKAADGYLTKMDFITDIPDTALGLQCEYNEYITDAKFLDTKDEAVAVVTRIESFKFMEKGRFVIHSFDETLGDQYVISEAGNPTKVVENITVDIGGTVNVKYGVMPMHWSCSHLAYAINRLNRLQEAASPKYGAWRCTFDIYKVITVIDERSCNHYQFINVTTKGLEEYAKRHDEEELETSNSELRNELYDSKCKISKLYDKIESIKKEARNWKTMYESEAETLDILKDVIDIIYSDLQSVTACDDLKDTLKALGHNSDLDHIYMPTKTNYILDNGDALTAKDEICYIINQIIIMNSRELNQSVAFSSAEEVIRAKSLANDIILICEADDKFDVTLKKFSQLYEAVNDPRDDDYVITYAFKGVLEIFSSLEDHVRDIIDKKHRLRVARNAIAEVMFAMRNAIYNNDRDAFCCINDRMIHDSDFSSDPFMAGVRENIRDICNACFRNIENNNLKNSEIARLTKERDDALELKEMYKRQANSVYGMSIPCRCNGKQMFYDITTGKKILVDKEKYDDLVECVNTINTTYDILKCADLTMNKPLWFDGIISRIENLTK